VWLEELAPEARARKASLLSAWVDAAESLRSAIHAHESERGPLVEALFPVWRGASLRRHADQALVAETELQRRLGSTYVLRRLAELATQSAVGPALEALAAAGPAWAAERDRPALAGAESEELRRRLLAVAREGAQLLERVRWVVRAALVHRADLVETVFPKRARPAAADTASSEGGAGDADSGTEAAPGDLVSATETTVAIADSPDTERDDRASSGSAAAPTRDRPSSGVDARTRDESRPEHVRRGATGRRSAAAPSQTAAPVGGTPDSRASRPVGRRPAADATAPEATAAPVGGTPDSRASRPVGRRPAAHATAPVAPRAGSTSARAPRRRSSAPPAAAAPGAPAAPEARRRPAPRGGRRTSRPSRRS